MARERAKLMLFKQMTQALLCVFYNLRMGKHI